MNELALFAGAGGGILGGKLLGWRTAVAVERDAYAAAILAQRQNDGALDPFPIWSDVCSFDGKPWRGIVDVVSGGFPCQDISVAGKGVGIDGARSGLWREMARIIGEVRPRFVFVENSPALIRRGLARVLGDLASMGYDARWGIIGADDVGAPHHRKRIWILAYTNQDDELRIPGEFSGTAESQWLQERDKDCQSCCTGEESEVLADAPVFRWDTRRTSYAKKVKERRQPNRSGQREDVPNATGERLEGLGADAGQSDKSEPGHGDWWATEPELGRVVNGMAYRVDRLKAIGNGQVPGVAALAWRILGGPVNQVNKTRPKSGTFSGAGDET